MLARTAARLASPKQRKHTRHWAPEYDRDTRVGRKVLDTARIVDDATWAVEAEDAVRPVVSAAAITLAVGVFAGLAWRPPPGTDLPRAAALVTAASVDRIVGMVGRSVRRQAERLSQDLARADQTDETVEGLVGVVRAAGDRLRGWVEGVATHTATATHSAAGDDAAREVNRDDLVTITREWVSRRDGKVRGSHAPVTGADGQVRGLDEPFIVGTALLMGPGDPDGPLRETANCRCRLRYRNLATGRWVSLAAAADAT